MKKNLAIQQGATFEAIIRWESLSVTFKAITGFTNAAPPVVTATSHGMPDGWRAAFTNVGGAEEIDAAEDPPASSDFHNITKIDANSFSIDGVDATGFGTYTSGGVVRYYTPIDLAGYTARMQIRQTLSAATTIIELTTENGRITLDNTAKTITLTISATDTEALSFTSGVYSLELVSSGGEVTQLLTGTVTLTKEITR